MMGRGPATATVLLLHLLLHSPAALGVYYTMPLNNISHELSGEYLVDTISEY